MALTAGQTAAVWAQFVRQTEREDIAFTKAQFSNAITAADTWVDANKASFNAALPNAFATSATAIQKARLLTLVAMQKVS